MDDPGESTVDADSPADSWVVEGRRLRHEALADRRRGRERGVIGATLISVVLALNGFGALLLFPQRLNPWLVVLLLFVPAIVLAGSAVLVVRRLR
jgi:hypothetical protein